MSAKRIGIILGGVAALLIVINLALHFGQKHHDRLDYDVNTAFPPDKPFLPEEIYATTLAEIMDHELHTGFGWRPNDFFLSAPHVIAANNADHLLVSILSALSAVRGLKELFT